MYYVPRYILLNMYRTYPLILMLSRVLEKSWSLILMMRGLLLLLCLTRNFWKDWGKFAECIPTSLNKSQEIGFWVAPGCYVGHKDFPSMINVVWHLLKKQKPCFLKISRHSMAKFTHMYYILSFFSTRYKGLLRGVFFMAVHLVFSKYLHFGSLDKKKICLIKNCLI